MTQRHIFVSRNAEWEKTAQKDFFLPEAAQVLEVDNALILPFQQNKGGVLNEKGQWLAGTSRYLLQEKTMPCGDDCIGAYQVPQNQIENINESVIFGGVLMGQFGHFLVDSMARFWYFLKNPQDTRRIVFMKGWGWFIFGRGGGEYSHG